jgi:hypothetical protein
MITWKGFGGKRPWPESGYALLLHVSAYSGHHQAKTILYTHPYFCLLYLPTLASVYTLGVCCSGILLM